MTVNHSNIQYERVDTPQSMSLNFIFMIVKLVLRCVPVQYVLETFKT